MEHTAQPMQDVHVTVFEGPVLVADHAFAVGTTLTVGRSAGADIRLNDRTISRTHATITLCQTGFCLEDHSLNGVDVDPPIPADDADYRYGARLCVGRFHLVVGTAQEQENSGNLRRRALATLIRELDLDAADLSAQELRHRAEPALERILYNLGIRDPDVRAPLLKELTDEACGLGPLERLLEDDTVSEIMVVRYDQIWIERKGKLVRSDLVFSSEDSLRTIIDRIVIPLGRRIDESAPMVDARLADGSRVNAVIPPLAIDGSCLTIRKFSKNKLTVDDLIAFGSMNRDIADFLQQAVCQRQNIVISGGTGSGKTTLLNVLSTFIPEDERIITVEDAAELSLSQPHVVRLESKPPNAEGKGAVTIRDLVRNTLRMRPDRIVVGECRGGEALDMLQAMNTGHDGSLTTTHANSPTEAISRLETLCLMAGVDLPSRAIREQIANAVHLIVQQTRLSDGSRKITAISEVCGIDDFGCVRVEDLYRYDLEEKTFVATGRIPRFLIEGGHR